MRVQQEINKLVYVDGKPIAEYDLVINLGRRCDFKYWNTGENPFFIQPQNIPVWQFIKESFAMKFCHNLQEPHMELRIKQTGDQQTYTTSNGEIARYKHNIWSFNKGKFVHFTYFSASLNTANAPIYEDFMKNFSPINQQLSKAVADRNIKKAQKLLLQGADENGSNNFFKHTPLMYAVYGDNKPMLELLLSYHPSFKPKDPSDYSALALALRYGSPETIHIMDKYIDENKDKYTPEATKEHAEALMHAVNINSLPKIKDIIQQNVYLSSPYLSEALRLSITKNNPSTNSQLDITKFLLYHGGDVNFSRRDAPPILPLIISKYCNHNFDMIKTLVFHDANLQAEYAGKTAMTLALQCKNKDIANYLQAVLDRN